MHVCMHYMYNNLIGDNDDNDDDCLDAVAMNDNDEWI